MVGQDTQNREENTGTFDAARIQMLAKLRARFLAGTLDEVLFCDNDRGMDRLIDDLFSDVE